MPCGFNLVQQGEGRLVVREGVLRIKAIRVRPPHRHPVHEILANAAFWVDATTNLVTVSSTTTPMSTPGSTCADPIQKPLSISARRRQLDIHQHLPQCILMPAPTAPFVWFGRYGSLRDDVDHAGRHGRCFPDLPRLCRPAFDLMRLLQNLVNGRPPRAQQDARATTEQGFANLCYFSVACLAACPTSTSLILPPDHHRNDLASDEWSTWPSVRAYLSGRRAYRRHRTPAEARLAIAGSGHGRQAVSGRQFFQ